MSIRSEIRAQLVSGPKSTDELLPLVPAAEGDRVRLSANMSTLAASGMVRRTGLSDDGKPLYQLEPKLWPAKEEPDLSVAIATLPPSLKNPVKESATKKASTPKLQRPAADPARKAANPPAAKTRARQPAAALSDKSPGKHGANSRTDTGRAVVLSPSRAESIFVGLMASGEIRVQDLASGFHVDLPPGVAAQIATLARISAGAGAAP